MVDFQHRLCHICECVINRRSKHCYFCNRCVSKFDHHCVFLLNCVGEYSFRYFIGFTYMFSLMGMIGMRLIIFDIQQLMNNPLIEQKLQWELFWNTNFTNKFHYIMELMQELNIWNFIGIAVCFQYISLGLVMCLASTIRRFISRKGCKQKIP